MKLIRSFIFAGIAALLLNSAIVAQQTGSLGGQVVDTLGSVVVGATVTAVSADGKEKTTTTNQRGEFTISGLEAGNYIVRVIADKFSFFENPTVEVKAGPKTNFTATLTVAALEQKVEVAADSGVSTDPDANASSTVLKEKDLEGLPDDPDELEAALQAIAGPAAGPNGGQIYIDGFTGGRMPPKEAIREIRINQNPFSAEYDRVGFGRIEILTKPGFEKFRGSANFNFNDESLNSRNPFAANRAPSQRRNYSGFFSGPIKAKKSSFFVDVSENQSDENAVISATIIDPSFNIVPFNEDITVPTRRFSVSPRIDLSINDKNTLGARYSFTRSKSVNQPGGFSLASRGSNSSSTQHSVQLTESMIINPKTVNETRVQYEFNRRDQKGDNSIPTINVSGAFVGGGAQVGLSYNQSNRWEVQNYTTTTLGKASQHGIKFGVRVRGISIKDRSESGYGGSFTFSGFVDNAGTPGDISDDVFVSSIEQYRQKVLGNPDPRYNPNQFSLTAGNPLASVSQIDYGPFFTDDWKVRQGLTLSFGLRYENQTNIHDNLNFAPRVGFAWAPGAGGAKQPKTVFRGGFGVFFDRFSENSTLRANRQNGTNQLQFLVTTNDNNILGQSIFGLDGVTNVPTAAQLGTFAPLASIPYRIDGNIHSPYSLQAAISVERQLPFKSVLSATFTMAKSEHVLRQRNINAPVCPSIAVCPAGLAPAQVQTFRPDPASGNIYEIESSGYANSQLLAIGIRSNFSPKVSINGGYTLNFAKGDTDSFSSPRATVNAVGFPAYNYDFSNEYAPSVFVPRHSVFIVTSFTLPWRIRLNPMVIASSGRPFNITSGSDTNYDSIFAERPTFSQLATKCGELHLTYSFCDISGIANPDTTIIPRNYGMGPATFITNLNLSKTFGFGGSKVAPVANSPNGQGTDAGNRGGRGGRGGGGGRGGAGGGGGGRGGAGGGPVMMGGGGGGFFGGGETPKPYNLTFGINVQNVFNTVNLNSPVGQLTSPFFGQSRSTAGGFGFFGGGGGGSANRRVDLSVRFSW